MDRREFIKKSLVVGSASIGASTFGSQETIAAETKKSGIPDLVAVKNGEPDVMFDKAIEAIGGMKTIVKPDQIVVVKPNMAWDRPPEMGANTNPKLIRQVVAHCVEAGAKKVYVLDHTCNNPQKVYQNSKIKEAAESAGGIVVYANDEKNYKEVSVPKAKVLKKVKVHELIESCDVFINVPVLKHHSGAGVTIAMKNLMGAMWDRRFYHQKGLHQCIAEFCLWRKPDLNIVDAYRVTIANGPHRARPEDVKLRKSLLLGKDIVAVDTAATILFGADPEKTNYIKIANELGLGEMDLSKLNIKKITV